MSSAGDLAKRIRTATGWSQEALAREVGVSFASVNAWERGRSSPRETHVAKLREIAARVLGDRGPMRVLVVDDDPVGLMVVEGHLESLDPPVELHLAQDGQQGLLLCGAVKPDLLLLDVMMPGLDGIEVAHRLSTVPGLETTRVVFITATNDDPQTRRRMDDVGPLAVLGKPVDGNRLRSIVAATQKDLTA